MSTTPTNSIRTEPASLDKLCIHTITTKPWNLQQAIQNYAQAGVKGITIWRAWMESQKPTHIRQQILDAGLEVVSVCRGGFFPAATQALRTKAWDDNRLAIDQCYEYQAPLLVLVCGAEPTIPLSESRKQIHDAIEALVPLAAKAKVRLAIEPLHPMYADTRSAINTLQQANELAEQIHSEWVGVAVDVYHVWWDPDLEHQIKRCAKQNHLFAFHVCDWRTPTEDLLNDRGLMGEGCIPIRSIRRMVEESGFHGYNEVEIFSNRYWQMDQDEYLTQIVDAYKQFV